MFGMTSDIWQIYDIYADVCLGNNRLYVEQYAKYGSIVHQAMLQNDDEKRNEINPPYEPCSSNFATQYLNVSLKYLFLASFKRLKYLCRPNSLKRLN